MYDFQVDLRWSLFEFIKKLTFPKGHLILAKEIKNSCADCLISICKSNLPALLTYLLLPNLQNAVFLEAKIRLFMERKQK